MSGAAAGRAPRAAGGAAVLLLLLVCSVAHAAPPTSAAAAAPAELADYDPQSTAWNGMASFVALAEGMGFEVTPVSTLEWSDLTADDILVLVYPLQRVDPSRLSSFIQAGGNVVVADDFGESREAMSALGLLRADVVTPRGTRFQDDHLWAPIATVRAPDHPIAIGVDDVVTNHPAALTHVEGATEVIGFDTGAIVVAGERGTGRFVAIADPSILINRMQQFPGNVAVATNMLRWLSRDGHARHVVLLRGDVPMFGDPRPYIADAHAGEVGKDVADLNDWLSERRAWLLTPPAMRTLAALLAIALLGLAVFALPVRRGPRIDGAWVRFGRPVRRDDAHGLVTAADRGDGGAASTLVLASVLRDHAQRCLEIAIDKPEPLYTLPEAELVTQVMRACGAEAGNAVARVYRRLRALPSRSQAAAPWSAGQLTRRDFDALYRDVAELCRTLGQPLAEASEPAGILEV